MATMNRSAPAVGDKVPQMTFNPSTLPLSQLESLRFKSTQIIESIQSLQRTLEGGWQPVMPAWPDILAKYNLILSQTHSFSTSLVSASTYDFEKIALHPHVGMSDAQLDSEVAPLLRNQQTLDVLKMENETVRRLSEHMNTRGSIGVLSNSQRKAEYEDVLRECAQIRDEHDRRVERAVRAVTMLKEKFDWKQRVEVELEEPEEITWEPPSSQGPLVDDEDGESDEEEDDEDQDGENFDSGDEGEVHMLVHGGSSPAVTPGGDVVMQNVEA